VTFPAGRFEFIHAFEDELGPYRMCSLFSPVLEFADQESAEATAQAVLAELFSTSADDDEDRDMVDIWEGRVPEAEAIAALDNTEVAPAGESVAMTRRSLLGLRGAGEADG
jgi:[NiFe] hydrogenase assembly HybE family chaperone